MKIFWLLPIAILLLFCGSNNKTEEIIQPKNEIEKNIYDYIDWLSSINKYSDVEEIEGFKNKTINIFYPVYKKPIYCPNFINDTITARIMMKFDYEEKYYNPEKEAVIVLEYVDYILPASRRKARLYNVICNHKRVKS